MQWRSSGSQGFFGDFKRFTPLLLNLVSKDIKIKYRRSALGVAWSVLNPLLTMIVLTAVFQKMMRISVDGDYPTYYIVGSTLWNFFSEATNLSMGSILGSAPLIKKVYIPKYMFPLEKCFFSLVNFLFSMVAVLIVMFVRGVYPTWTFLLFPLAVLYCFVFTCGISLFLSAANVYFRDVAHLYGVFLTLWMYLTPVIYQTNLVGDNSLILKVIKCNPMYYYITYFRDVVMYGTVPGLMHNLICLVTALAAFIIGAFVFKKAEGKFILHI